jgi:hypothetical protein
MACSPITPDRFPHASNSGRIWLDGMWLAVLTEHGANAHMFSGMARAVPTAGRGGKLALKVLGEGATFSSANRRHRTGKKLPASTREDDD